MEATHITSNPRSGKLGTINEDDDDDDNDEDKNEDEDDDNDDDDIDSYLLTKFSLDWLKKMTSLQLACM